MISIRPYLLRAYFDWIIDNGWTPYLLVNAAVPGTEVPQEFVNDGRIVLNVTPRAVHDFAIGNEAVTFSARFAGVSRRVLIPVEAVLAIYPQETGEGLSFPAPGESHPAPAAPEEPPPPAPPGGPKRPSLRIVKEK